jgi:hypothetical protein
MNKFFYPLRFRDVLSLVVLIAIAFGWLLIDQMFLPETYQRFMAFMVLILALYSGQFMINKPDREMAYATSLAAVTVAFGIILSVIMHVMIRHDFTLKSVLIWLIAGIFPYLAAMIYKGTSKNRTSINS